MTVWDEFGRLADAVQAQNQSDLSGRGGNQKLFKKKGINSAGLS